VILFCEWKDISDEDGVRGPWRAGAKNFTEFFKITGCPDEFFIFRILVNDVSGFPESLTEFFWDVQNPGQIFQK
jgi:hypothetical protein